jgi:hypothetical protein
MKNTETVDYLKYKEYLDFINECSNKNYDTNLVLHKHHIIPRHLKGSNDKSNLVNLSVEDHAEAHIMFSRCFDVNSYEYISNLQSARLLIKKSVRFTNEMEKIKQTYMGENNPFFGKTHTDESKKKIGEATIRNRKDISYDEFYGEEASNQRHIRSIAAKNQHENTSKEKKKEIGDKISNSLKGNIPWNKGRKSKYLVDGNVFETLDDALSFYNCKYLKKLKDNHTVERINE